MKKIIASALLMLITVFGFSQEMKTLFSKDSSKKNSYGGYGAPFVGATQLNGDFSTIIGAKGGVIKNHKFVFGGVGGSIIGSKKTVHDTIKTKDGSADSLWIKQNPAIGYGGLFVEYIFNYSSPVHVSIPLHLQMGGVFGGHQYSNIKSSLIYVIESGVNIEFNFYKFFVPTINVGYRYVTGKYSPELSGVYGSLILKFGKF